MAAKFRKILCPVEFEQNSAAALRFARELAEPDGRLYLLHVIPEAHQPGFEPYPPTAELAREGLKNFAREQPAGKVNPELLVRTGNPAEIIVSMADELDVDLIVMAMHGHKGIARLILGSVAGRVVREARHPVLTLRPEIAVQPKSA